MRIARIALPTLGWLAVIGSCCAAMAAAPIINAKDVAMGTDGQLHGMVVDSTGAGVPGVPVTLRLSNQQVASVMTDKEGLFAVNGLKGGVYQVAAPQSQEDFRVWHSDAAPPGAGDRIVLRQQGPYVQEDNQPLSMTDDPPAGSTPVYQPVQVTRGLGRPLLIGTAIAAAIAIPVALTNQKKPHSP